MSTVKQAPYATLADIYDYIMRHVDYDNWARYIDSIMRRFGHRPANLVDLACGTGNLTFELDQLEYAVTGVDSSPGMLRVAREKAAGREREIDFLPGDLRQLSGLGPFDAAVCVYDSFNYLLTAAEVSRALEEVFQILLPHSLFVFDVCTEQNSLRYFRDLNDAEAGPGFSYRRHSYYTRRKRMQYNHFFIEFEGRTEVSEELHQQYIYPWRDLVAHIKASPFELLDAFDGFTFEKGSARSERIHFVLRCPEARPA